MRLLILAAAALFACLPARAQTGNPQHDALVAKPDAERRAALHNVVRAGGNTCTQLQVAFEAGLDAQRNAYWDLRCAGGVSYRATIPAERFAPVAILGCGALVPPPRSGPCFQTLATVAAQAQNAAALAGARQTEAQCREACAGDAACARRCVSGQGVQSAAAASAQPPPGSRFGVVYQTDRPLAAFGFANGAADRLEVNMRAVRQCQGMAGEVRCQFVGELVNTCAALAFSISRHPRAMVMTEDLSTQILNASFLARAATRAEAEAEAMRQCTQVQGPGASCRVVAAGC